MSTTTIRVSADTRDALNAIAQQRGQTLTETIARAVTLLEQESIAHDLATDLRSDETEWLDAEAG